MNNNRTNRRRGRGNRNQGGGNQSNRIDSRARGNAPQMLDKYKKLAQDAQHNGDRVQAEYYLQFADHYFRVIADNKARQDEHRGKRPDERGSSDEDDDQGDEDEDRNRGNRRPRDRRDNRDNRDDRRDNRDDRRDDNAREAQGGEGAEGPRYEPGDNPFMRDEGDEKPKRQAPRRRKAGDDGASAIDAAALPPSIGAKDDTDANADAEAEAAPRRPRKRAAGGGKLSAVG